MGNEKEGRVKASHAGLSLSRVPLWLEEMRDNIGPLVQVGQPAYGAIGGKNNIKLLIEVIFEIIDIAANKAARCPQLFIKPGGCCDALLGKVYSGNGSAFPIQRNGILPKMTLQV